MKVLLDYRSRSNHIRVIGDEQSQIVETFEVPIIEPGEPEDDDVRAARQALEGVKMLILALAASGRDINTQPMHEAITIVIDTIERMLPEMADQAPETGPEPKSDPRIIAEFVPQAWVNDYAVDVDPEGETTFDVTDHLLALPRERLIALTDNSDDSDDLRSLSTAPAWVREWRGPFYVRVENAIRNYLDQTAVGIGGGA